MGVLRLIFIFKCFLFIFERIKCLVDLEDSRMNLIKSCEIFLKEDYIKAVMAAACLIKTCFFF